MGRRLRTGVLATSSAVATLLVGATAALGCSPPFNPSIDALGPDQTVVVGTIGVRTAEGRVFHVERWFNGGQPAPQLVIAFQEGEPMGDCSYPVASGQRLIIAPEQAGGGRLSANLATLQADPDSDDGRRYLAEAERLFGPGVDMASAPPAAEAGPPVALVIAAVVSLVAAALLGSIALAARRA